MHSAGLDAGDAQKTNFTPRHYYSAFLKSTSGIHNFRCLLMLHMFDGHQVAVLFFF